MTRETRVVSEERFVATVTVQFDRPIFQAETGNGDKLKQHIAVILRDRRYVTEPGLARTAVSRPSR